MNKSWSEINKEVKGLLNKRDTFNEGINKLISLRNLLFTEWKKELNKLSLLDYSKQPYINKKGYDSKTIAYSIFHVARIEDIVLNTLIKKEEQIFIRDNYKSKLNSSIITTGNELKKEEISFFSKELNINELWNYFNNVLEESNCFLLNLKYEDLKITYSEEDKERIKMTKSVDEEENWLIEYWCNKDIKGLLGMPFSRHWIMHIEASLRIKEKIVK